jgi:Carbohydrate-selective porin, OprB family/S-layer homology domain
MAKAFVSAVLGRSIGLVVLVGGGWLWADSAQAVELLQPASPSAIAAMPSFDDEFDDEDDSVEQVTSVSQFTDVKPTDWAFQALQSLVERYGCIVGYPDKTFRGNRALTRYEFAAGLNACLDKVQELIAAATADFVKKEDLETVKKLQENFAVELATLRGRVDALDVRTSTLEKQQFSTTAKLTGEVLFYRGDALGETASDVNEASFNYRVRLTLNASFSGDDLLRVRLQAANMRLYSAGDPNIDNATGGFGAPQRFASTFPSAFSDETRILPSPASEGENDSGLRINDLSYRFPLGEKLTVYVAAGITDPTFLGADPIAPFSDWATGSISNFANSNPLYYPMGNRAGAGFNYKFSDWLTVAGGYVGQDVNDIGGPNIPLSTSGIFGGGYSAFGQVTLYLGKLSAGLVYLNTYTPQFGIDTLAGSNAAKVSTGGSFGVAEDDRVSANHYGATVNYKLSDKFQIGGWIGYAKARVLGVSTLGVPTGRGGDVGVLNYAVTLAFPDLLKTGNLGGIIVGMQPKVTSTSNAVVAEAIGLPNSRRQDRDTGFHVEAFYSFRVNDNITITPGVFWLTAPNHDSRNPDAIVGVVRTSFTF